MSPAQRWMAQCLAFVVLCAAIVFLKHGMNAPGFSLVCIAVVLFAIGARNPRPQHDRSRRERGIDKVL